MISNMEMANIVADPDMGKPKAMIEALTADDAKKMLKVLASATRRIDHLDLGAGKHT